MNIDYRACSLAARKCHRSTTRSATPSQIRLINDSLLEHTSCLLCILLKARSDQCFLVTALYGLQNGCDSKICGISRCREFIV